MSYDLDLFIPKPGLEGAAAIAVWQDEQEAAAGRDAGSVDPEKEKRKRELAAALIDKNPKFASNDFNDEAEMPAGEITLDAGEDSNGIQVMLFDDCAAVSIPYWHSGAAARAAFEEIWSYLKILEEKGGFVTYDPQLDRLLNLSVDLEQALATYTGVSAKMPEMIASHQKPWGKFW